jgi:hypothetical protein
MLETGRRVSIAIHSSGEQDVSSSEGKVHAAAQTVEQSVRRTLILIALYAIPAVVVLRPITDNDIWMNLRAGSWIVAHGEVPATDPFSSPGEGKPWVAYSWLFEVLVYGLHRRFGLAGIVGYRAVMAYAILLALHGLVVRREGRFVVATSLAGVAFFALVPVLNERTWLFTMLFSTLTLGAILDLRQGVRTRADWWLPVVFALWANVHIQFVYGLFLLALACAAPLCDRLLGRVSGMGGAGVAGTREWWWLVVLCGACLLATLLNPYGARLYAVVYQYAAQRETYNQVLELLAPAFRMPWEWAMPVLVGAAAWALGRRRERSAFDVILLATVSFLALRARRDVWFAVLGALAVLATATATATATAGRADQPAARGSRLRWSRRVIVALCVGVVLVVASGRLDLSQSHLEAKVAAVYPARAAAVVEERGYRGPLFNAYGWGSYLIWRLPAMKVSIDGRADLHGPERIRRNTDTLCGLRGWDSDADLDGANTVILGTDLALTALLRRDRRFTIVHEDDVAAVFLRHPEEIAWTGIDP